MRHALGRHALQTAFSSIRRPAGDVAHLILSGPSVADIGYSELDLPAVMGVNGSIALRRSHPHLRFAYYAMLDAGFVSRRRDLVADVLAQDLLLFVTPEVLRGIAQLFSPDDIRCRIAVFEEVHQRAYLPRAQPEQLARTLRDDPDLVLFDAHAPIHPLGFSLDPARGLFGGGTVAYSALQLLVWLGFRTLYLHGLDLRGASVSPRFYESADARLPSALDRQFDSHIRPAFRDASRLLGARGLRIYNLSPGSALDERVSQAPLDDAETARASVLTARRQSSFVQGHFMRILYTNFHQADGGGHTPTYCRWCGRCGPRTTSWLPRRPAAACFWKPRACRACVSCRWSSRADCSLPGPGSGACARC